MSVSFFKHKKALIDAYKDVLNDGTDTDWALFTYEGKENELKVADTGEDGLEELESEFNSGKIMYAFIRVKDPKTSLHKFIFLHWQGEGAPANRKGACANHVQDVKRFFKGAHITINARNEEDVTPDQIMEHVSRASASTYAFDKSQASEYDEPAVAVGSVYKRTNAQAEISSTRNDSYWAKQEREEEERKREEGRKKAEERRKYVEEIRSLEKESTRRRSEWEKAREREISEKMRAAKVADDTSYYREMEKEKWEAEQREMEADSQRGRKRSESIEKAAEAAHLVQKRDSNPRAMWERKINEANRPNTFSEKRETSSNSYVERSIPEDKEDSQIYHEVFENNHSNHQPETTNEPEQHANEPEQPTYDEPVLVDQPTETQYVPEKSTYDEPVSGQHADDYYYSDQFNDPQPQQGGESYADVGDTGYQARTLYDYEAADGTEISFDPDVVITNISMVDEGWWQGTAPDGRYGLFPANYVELIE